MAVDPFRDPDHQRYAALIRDDEVTRRLGVVVHVTATEYVVRNATPDELAGDLRVWRTNEVEPRTTRYPLTQPDPELPTAQRNRLILQGARQAIQLHRQGE